VQLLLQHFNSIQTFNHFAPGKWAATGMQILKGRLSFFIALKATYFFSYLKKCFSSIVW
jgi:hypothetical protein